jgi:hypothetical protein
MKAGQDGHGWTGCTKMDKKPILCILYIHVQSLRLLLYLKQFDLKMQICVRGDNATRAS